MRRQPARQAVSPHTCSTQEARDITVRQAGPNLTVAACRFARPLRPVGCAPSPATAAAAAVAAFWVLAPRAAALTAATAPLDDSVAGPPAQRSCGARGQNTREGLGLRAAQADGLTHCTCPSRCSTAPLTASVRAIGALAANGTVHAASAAAPPVPPSALPAYMRTQAGAG